jgi:hypothetical protein
MEKPIYDSKNINRYKTDEVLMWDNFEKQKIFEIKTRPTLYEIFECVEWKNPIKCTPIHFEAKVKVRNKKNK